MHALGDCASICERLDTFYHLFRFLQVVLGGCTQRRTSIRGGGQRLFLVETWTTVHSRLQEALSMFLVIWPSRTSSSLRASSTQQTSLSTHISKSEHISSKLQRENWCYRCIFLMSKNYSYRCIFLICIFLISVIGSGLNAAYLAHYPSVCSASYNTNLCQVANLIGALDLNELVIAHQLAHFNNVHNCPFETASNTTGSAIQLPYHVGRGLCF
jgi:hypothetical protein